MIFYRSILFLIVVLVFFSLQGFAQTADSSWQVYDDSQLARIDVTISPASLAWIYQNVNSDSDHVARVRFRNKWIDQSFDSVGFRLRGETSRQSQKKSFKITFNSFIKGRKLCGLKDLNVNGEHNDPSIIRSKLCFDLFAKAGVKASRAAHTELYINGKFYGLYISVENIDDTFLKRNYADDNGNLWKCLYPADLKYLGSTPAPYINLMNNGRPAYELKTNEAANDFSQFVRLVSIINNTSDSALPDSLEGILDVADVLKYFAMNVLVGGWDSYWPLMNNYYLYHQPSIAKFTLIPYDYDNTFGVDWSGINWYSVNPYNMPKVVSGSRPLAERLVANAQYKNLYTHFLAHLNSNIYMLPLWESHIDSIKSRINNAASRDSFRVLDYGFSFNDFNNSYSATPFSYAHVKTGLKQFVNSRYNALPSQLQYVSAAPMVYKIDYYPKNPSAGDSIHVVVAAYDNNGLSQVALQFIKNGSGGTLSIPMTAAPVTGSLKIEDIDRYIGVIPPLGAGGTGQFTVLVKDNQSQSMTYPRTKPVIITATASITNNLVINEFLADNTQYPDPSGEFDDYIEIYNPTSRAIKLTGMYMTDSPTQLKKWRVTAESLYIAPNSFLVVWADEQLTQPGVHAGFKLSKSGEYIALTDTDGVSIIDSVTFGPQNTNISFGRTPDGSPVWKTMQPTPGMANPVTSVPAEGKPISFMIYQNYPNPFNPETVIRYDLLQARQNAASRTMVTLRIYDILGRMVSELVNTEQYPGSHSATWNAAGFPAGIYYYQLTAGSEKHTRKMVLLK